ncbi:hypothetical protein F4861DRAFT_509856 [Xylaria intraflava]|nr:hypothetical protein F4861DRAFT_509856 [Xylaria intraflava]
MPISRRTTPEAEASDQPTGRDAPGALPQDNDVEVPREHNDTPVQSPKAAACDEPGQEASLAKSDDHVESSKDTTTEASNAGGEAVTNTTSGPSSVPNQPSTAEQDDGWGCHWDHANQAWFFYNSITNESTWNNPRVPAQDQASAGGSVQPQPSTTTAVRPASELPAGGYNPAIHGDYDPNAWYAKNNQEENDDEFPVMDTATAYATIGSFNRFTGRWQGNDQGPDRHNDEAKSRRQMNAFFDVDAAANAHNGRSLKAERSGKKPTKTELKQFKEKRRARKEEKRRAWLRD